VPPLEDPVKVAPFAEISLTHKEVAVEATQPLVVSQTLEHIANIPPLLSPSKSVQIDVHQEAPSAALDVAAEIVSEMFPTMHRNAQPKRRGPPPCYPLEPAEDRYSWLAYPIGSFPFIDDDERRRKYPTALETASCIIAGFLVGAFITLSILGPPRRPLIYLT